MNQYTPPPVKTSHPFCPPPSFRCEKLTLTSAAEDDPNCSIYGMPVLRVWKSGLVYVLKRSVGSTGYTGLGNPILYKDNVEILLGDAKESCEALRTHLNDL